LSAVELPVAGTEAKTRNGVEATATGFGWVLRAGLERGVHGRDVLSAQTVETAGAGGEVVATAAATRLGTRAIEPLPLVAVWRRAWGLLRG